MSLMTFTKIALRNLFSKPVTTKYPFEPAKYPERSRGHIELNLEECILCGNCGRHCPTETIQVDRKKGTWSMNRFDCVQCGNCIQYCPKKCLTIVPGYFTPGVEKVCETYTKPVSAPKPAAKTGSVPAAEPADDPVAQADLSKCKFCGLCAKNCPNECITVDRKAKTWSVNAEECVGCGACQSACHFGAITIGAAAAAPAPVEKSVEAEKAEGNVRVIKLPGRRPLTVPLKPNGKEVPVPACVRPEYNEQWSDLPVCNPDKCKYCTLCAKKCPKGAIEVNRKEKFWEVDNAECVRCGVCLENCNFGALSMKGE